MPEINVTMGDGGGIAVDVSVGGTYSDADVADALAAGVPAVDTDELLVGTTSPVTATVGTSGEFEQFGVYEYAPKGYSVSSSTFQTVATAVDEHRTIDTESVLALTNIESAHVAISGRLFHSGSGVDVTVRVEGRPETEKTVSSPKYSFTTTPKTDDSQTIPRNPFPELKTSDGSQATIFNPSVIVYGKIA